MGRARATSRTLSRRNARSIAPDGFACEGLLYMGFFFRLKSGTVDVDAATGGYHRIAAFASKAPCPAISSWPAPGKRHHSSPRQGLSHAHRVPAPAAGGGNAPGVEGVGNGAKGRCPGFADLSNDRQDVARRAIGFRLDGGDGFELRDLDIGIAKLDALRLRRRERRLGAPGDQCALFLG